jgi:hypothetical protein
LIQCLTPRKGRVWHGWVRVARPNSWGKKSACTPPGDWDKQTNKQTNNQTKQTNKQNKQTIRGSVTFQSSVETALLCVLFSPAPIISHAIETEGGNCEIWHDSTPLPHWQHNWQLSQIYTNAIANNHRFYYLAV